MGRLRIRSVFFLCLSFMVTLRPVLGERLLVTLRDGVQRRRLEAVMGNASIRGVPFSSKFKHFETLSSKGATNQIVLLECEWSCSNEVKEMYGDNALAVEEEGQMSIEVVDDGDGGNALPSEGVVSWGLDRIDGTLDQTIRRPLWTGKGVKVFVLDTGTMGTHSEFSPGRVERGRNFVTGSDTDEDRGDVDCNGHGTHVASLIAGKSYGVATGATIVPLRVLNCGGYGLNSWIIRGVNYAADSTGPRVIHMSIGGNPSTALDKSVEYALSRGVAVVVAAGNKNGLACFYSPSRVKGAITVGASTSTDSRASYSNYGDCVDVWAPGSAILGAWPSTTSTTLTRLMSGTSMAAPFVSGFAATLLERSKDISPDRIAWLIVSMAQLDVLVDVKTSPNVLLNVLGTGTARPTRFPTNSPTNFPTRQPTHSPTSRPSTSPTHGPTTSPTSQPTPSPTLPLCPTSCKCEAPSMCGGEQSPTSTPTKTPTARPSLSERPGELFCHRRMSEEVCMEYWPWCNWAKKKNLCYKRLD